MVPVVGETGILSARYAPPVGMFEDHVFRPVGNGIVALDLWNRQIQRRANVAFD